MKICHFIASKGLGRGEAYIDLVNVLCRKMDIVLLVPHGALFLERVDKRIQIIEYQRKNSRTNPLLYIELYKILVGIQVDLVHTHFAKASLIFHRLNHLLHLPHVATKHNPRKGKIYNKLQNVIAVSESVKRSITHDRVKVIYNGLIPEKINKKREQNPIFTICSVGRLDKIKGFDVLIRACAELAFDYQLNIVGEGNEREALEILIQKQGVGKHVYLQGFRTDIPQVMNQADLVVVSSLSEGFSLAALEGLFYGRMLLSTKVGIPAEIFPDNLLLEASQFTRKITDVFNNYCSYQEEFQALKKKYASRFLLDNIVSEYIDYYKDVSEN